MRVRPVLLTPDEPRLPQLLVQNNWSLKIMTRSDRDFATRSQNSRPLPADLVTCDRKTLKDVLRTLSRCSDAVQAVNHQEIMLVSLDNYLTEGKNINVNKSILLLQSWLEFVPERLKEVEERLNEVHETIRVILEATK